MQTSHILMAVKDFKKAEKFFRHLGYQHVVNATMRDQPCPEIQDGQQAPEPDQVYVLADEKGFSIDLSIWYETMEKYFGGSDLICISVDDLDAVWASLEGFPGVKRLVPPSPVSKEMQDAIENLEPGRFSIISVDLDREDGKAQLIELIEGLVPPLL